MKNTVVIYRDQLLPYSETFIPTQVESFTTYRGYYVGTSRIVQTPSLIPVEQSITLSDVVSHPTPWKMAFKLGGVIHPRWLRPVQMRSPSLVHAHLGLDGVWGLILARKLNIPLIVTFHGNDITGMDYRGTGRIRWSYLFTQRGQFFRDIYLARRDQMFAEARCFIAVSHFIRNRLIEKGCPPDKIQVNYIGVDTEKFKPDPAIQRTPVVLFVGRLVEKKGCQYLIQAMEKVQKFIPDAKLVIIGDGPLRSRLETLAQGSLSAYQFLGKQPHAIVKDWMNRASVLCSPSVTASTGDSEGLPTVITEAQAMGVPVVASLHAGIPEAIAHGETGLLSPEKNWEALADHVLMVLSDAQLREQFAIAGRKRMEEHFSLKQNSLELEGLYDRVLSQSA